jgi:hypothetical protein
MTTPIINLEDLRTNACDYILRYTIRDEKYLSFGTIGNQIGRTYDNLLMIV